MNNSKSNKHEIYFMPLGGGQSVGVSCYYLRLGSSNIILDSGMKTQGTFRLEPDFYSLLTSPFIMSLNQIGQIFISHAHSDHTGSLLNLMKNASHAGVYMTRPTRLLTEHQLYDKKNFTDENQRLAVQYLLQQIVEVNYMQTITFNEYNASFFQAGHIPGAMMTYFTHKDRKILYTGDYSLHSTALTGGCVLPENLDVDILIMCGLHARHPYYRRQDDKIYGEIKAILNEAEYMNFVTCHVSQLSKGVEFVKMLNMMNNIHVPVFIDDETMSIITLMEKLGEPVLTPDNHVISELEHYNHGIIIISSSTSSTGRRITRSNLHHNIDFSLHEDFEEMRGFIKLINPRLAVIVHCAQAYSDYDSTIEQVIMRDTDCRTQFIFAQDSVIYTL